MRSKIFGIAAPALRISIIGLVLVSLAACSVAANTITKLGVTNSADRVLISIQADCALRLSPLQTAKGHYIGFQFPCRLGVKGKLVGIHSGRVHNVRYSSFRANPPITRIVVNTSSHTDYSTQWSGDRKRVDISIWKLGRRAAAKSREPLPVAATAPIGVSESPAEPVHEVVLAQPVTEPIEHMPMGSDPAEPAKPTVRLGSKTETANRTMSAKAQQPVTVVEKPAVSKVETPAALSERKVSADFLAADINDVLKVLAEQSGKNIVSGKDVTGNVTLKLNNVTLDEALGWIARLSGYAYVKENDTYLVGTKASLDAMSAKGPEGSRVAVITLKNAASDDMIELLKARFPQMQAGKGSGASKSPAGAGAGPAPAMSNVLVLTGPENIVAQAQALVQQVDDTMHADKATRIYLVKYVRPTELAQTLTTLIPALSIAFGPSMDFDLEAPDNITFKEAGGASVKDAAKTQQEDPRPSSLVITGKPDDVKRAMEMAASLDIKAPQIKIEAKVTSLTETGEKKLGLSWSWDEFTKSNIAAIKWPVDSSWDIAARLDALIKEGNGRLLASPSILCVEGKPGMFFVGDEVHYIVLVQVTPTGTNVTTDVANVGVQLRVAGDVSPDGYITLSLHPEVSVLKLTQDKQAAVTLPIITRRFTDHVVRVKSGETVVIGGLILDQDLDELQKVPILGDLPLLGNLFRFRSKTREHSEVVMFITASIVED